jgi:hypothetical protein
VFSGPGIHQPSPTVDLTGSLPPTTVDVSSNKPVLESSEIHCPSPVLPYEISANCRIFLESTATRLEDKLEKKGQEKSANGHENGANAYCVEENVFLLCV